MARSIVTLALLIASAMVLCGQSSDFRKITDIRYGQVGDHELLLDLYLPNGVAQPPLLVYVHGGAWSGGTKNAMPLTGLVDSGFAVASVDYRLSPVARFPAQVHDIKASIRFLRAKEATYGYDSSAITITGSSAGGHLAALVGVTNGSKKLEGSIGNHLDQSSDVQAIVDYYGASNFLSILRQSTPHGLGVRIPALQLLLGAQPESAVELAKLASPVFHIDESDPPMILLHGDQDPQMPINQSHEFHGAYAAKGLPVSMEVLHGAAHGGPRFYDDYSNKLVIAFLDRYIRSR